MSEVNLHTPAGRETRKKKRKDKRDSGSESSRNRERAGCVPVRRLAIYQVLDTFELAGSPHMGR